MWKEVLEWIKQYNSTMWLIAFVLSLIIQVAPIKINPWSTLFKWIGKTITGDACSKIDGLIEKVNKIEKDVMINEKDRIRWEILDFANSCRNGRLHTKDEFQHVVALNDKYRQLLRETNDTNGVFEIEYEYIQRVYTERLAKNDFLL